MNKDKQMTVERAIKNLEWIESIPPSKENAGYWLQAKLIAKLVRKLLEGTPVVQTQLNEEPHREKVDLEAAREVFNE